ncbi:hypothetical protein MWU59_02495 [Flavobacteriaceae bacterium F08102]|nr:hypothetical protein [Flavobacteriaceae bacterium F08102]
MLRNILITAFFVITCTACSLDDNGSDASIETLPIKEAIVPEAFEYGETYTLTVTYDLPDSCHSFYDLYYEYSGDTRIVAVNSLVIGDECSSEPKTETRDFVVHVQQVEDYTFKFWKGVDDEGNDLFEEIIVPVN